jgi:hypothetical protein
MGAWGTGIFQDDLACDIRDRYRDLIGEGLRGPEATARILDECRDSLNDPDEGGVVWLALAAVQWQLGRLEGDTLERALRVIESGSDLKRWDVDSKDQVRREKALEKLRGQITSTRRPERKVARRVLCESPWRTGDLFAYRLLSDNFVIFRVIDNETDRGGTYPVCELLDWVGREIPQKEVLQQTNTRQSRGNHYRVINKMMLVGLKRKWMKRVLNLNLNLKPFHQRTWKFFPGTSIRAEHDPTVIVHFKILDKFLREDFLLQ